MTTIQKIDKKGYDLKYIGGNKVIVSKRNTESRLLANGRESQHASPTAALKYITKHI